MRECAGYACFNLFYKGFWEVYSWFCSPKVGYSRPQGVLPWAIHGGLSRKWENERKVVFYTFRQENRALRKRDPPCATLLSVAGFPAFLSRIPLGRRLFLRRKMDSSLPDIPRFQHFFNTFGNIPHRLFVRHQNVKNVGKRGPWA